MTDIERLNEAAEPLELEFSVASLSPHVYGASINGRGHRILGNIAVDATEIERHQSEKSLRNMIRERLRFTLLDLIADATEILLEI